MSSDNATTDRNMQIASTIIEQMGGLRRIAMFTGAYEFTACKNGVFFRIPGKGFAKDSINLVTIILTPRDEYDMTFSRIRGGKIKEIKKYEGVYYDMLVDLFQKTTGLYLSF